MGTGIPRTGGLGAGLLIFRVAMRAGSIGGDDLARLMADAPFLLGLQERGKGRVGSDSLRWRDNSSEFPEEGSLVTLGEAGGASLGWLKCLNTLKKGIVEQNPGPGWQLLGRRLEKLANVTVRRGQ